MIRPLRRRHRLMVAVIAAAVVVLYLAALAVRPDPALQKELSPDVTGVEPPTHATGNESGHDVGKPGDTR